jgi:hypothetical protein
MRASKVYFARYAGVARVEPLDDVLDRLALDVLHHEEVLPALVDAHVVDGHDVGVLEPPDRLDLVDEARHHGRLRDLGQDALQGDRAADVFIAREHHLAHGARAEHTLFAVAGARLGHEHQAVALRLDARQHRGAHERARERARQARRARGTARRGDGGAERVVLVGVGRRERGRSCGWVGGHLGRRERRGLVRRALRLGTRLGPWARLVADGAARPRGRALVVPQGAVAHAGWRPA